MIEALAIPAITRPSRVFCRPHSSTRRSESHLQPKSLSDYNRELREQRLLRVIARVEESPEEKLLRERGQVAGRRRGRPINLKPAILRLLAAGPMPLRAIVAAAGAGRSTVGNCLARSPWFTRIGVGIWTLTDLGRKQLEAIT